MALFEYRFSVWGWTGVSESSASNADQVVEAPQGRIYMILIKSVRNCVKSGYKPNYDLLMCYIMVF